MYEFKLRRIEEIKGKISFFKLFVNGRCEFDEFCERIKEDGNLKKQLAAVQARMEDIANLRRLPSNKFKKISPGKERVKEYEIKTKDLRIYLWHEEETGKVVVWAGKKSTQKKDIRRFRSIKKAYFK